MGDQHVILMLERPIPGVDHIRAFGSEELLDAALNRCDAESAGITPLEDFCVSYGGRPQWATAATGLKTTRQLISLYEKWTAQDAVPGRGTPQSIARKLFVLRRLESLLDRADSRDIRFCLKVKSSP